MSAADLYAEAEHAARSWFNAAASSAPPLGIRCYLWFLPHAMRLRVAPEAPTDAWELARPEHISPAWTLDRATAWIYETARRLPLLPVEEVAP